MLLTEEDLKRLNLTLRTRSDSVLNIKSREAVTKSTNEPSSSSPVPVVSVMETEHTELHNLLNIFGTKATGPTPSRQVRKSHITT